LLVLLTGCARYYYREGDIEYENMKFSKAISDYEKALNKKNFPDLKRKLANVYRLANNTVKAETLYKEITDSSSAKAADFLFYGKTLMNNGKYADAKNAFIKYKSLLPSDASVNSLIAGCDSATFFKMDSLSYELKNEHIGDFSLELRVVPFKNGIVFSADKDQLKHKNENMGAEDSYLDLYFMQKDSSGKWGNPELLNGNINGPYHDGPAAFAPGDTIMYFSRSNYISRRLKKNEQNVNTLKIFKAHLVNGKWENQGELPFNSDEYSVGHPSLSEDGKMLYFISDMPGGIGETDIYVSKFDNNKWSKPANLGSVINTTGREGFPYIHSDTLYFASEGHPGLGGLDIFYSHFDGSNWSQPHNMHAPVNSSKDDFAFVFSDKKADGYFSSNRNGEKENIYSFVKKERSVKPLIMDSLAMQFLTLIKENDTTDIPIVKNELLSVSTDAEKDTLAESEHKMIKERNDKTEKKYAQTLSHLVNSKKTNSNIDVMSRVVEKKKANAFIASSISSSLKEKPAKGVDKPTDKPSDKISGTIKNNKQTNQVKKDKTVTPGIEHVGIPQNAVAIKNIKLPKTKQFAANTTNSKKEVIAKYSSNSIINNNIKDNEAELKKIINEIEQIYQVKGKNPQSLLEEAKNRNEIVSSSLLTKDKEVRQQYLIALAKEISKNINVKYEKGNPLTDLYDIIDTYDKMVENSNKAKTGKPVN